MKTRTGVLVQAVLVAAFGLSLASEVQAEAPWKRGISQPVPRPKTFALSADYTGYLSGTLLINGVIYRLAPDATVYVIGSGPVTGGLMVNNASLYLAGDKDGRGGLVRSVIVCPGAASSNDAVGRSSDVGVAPEGSPR